MTCFTCTSAKHVDLELDLSIMALLEGLFKSDRLAKEISAITLVIIILKRSKEYYYVKMLNNTGYER